jgi:hydrogenase maturation protein HypF
MAHDEELCRLHITIQGAVQGVGFRPFVYRLATELGLTGWVNNSSGGVLLEVEGQRGHVEIFLRRLAEEKPPRSFIQSLESSWLDPVGFSVFEIRRSEKTGEKNAFILPDIATCPDCMREIFDEQDRRYRYPFTNCTNCGPRFSLIEALPYDRLNTTMRRFCMCEKCQFEYENPCDRRFHAQPNACPTCGPYLELWNREGRVLSSRDDALSQACEAIRHGQIVAVKGVGGYQLVVDARNEEAVRELRRRKHRKGKPLALMYPHLDAVRADCVISDLEEHLLLSPESPIVLLERRPLPSNIAPSVAPQNPYLGVMLPYSPLHHLLLAELGMPIVATSGNLSDEPICIDEHDALRRLGQIADVFLVHNRPIARHVDDSVVCVLMGRELVLRRARGYAPLPLHVRSAVSPALAVGAHLKSTVALALRQEVFVSQHIGDLETSEAWKAFHRVIRDFERLYDTRPQQIICDAHPDYLSTQYAKGRGLPVVQVQHHYAHVLSCMAENQVEGPVLGVAWDGTGLGSDGTIWGGEFLWATQSAFRRVGHLRTFRLPGGERAIREPKRAALGLLYELFGDDSLSLTQIPAVEAFSVHERESLRVMLQRELQAPRTSSAGRLFDAVAALLGLRYVSAFEGQAAMELEFAMANTPTGERYDVALLDGPETPIVIDWGPMVHGILADMQAGLPVSKISGKFHNTLAEAIVSLAHRVGEERVVLTGGCFQNRYLMERSVHRLRGEGFRPYWHQRVPPHDGGIALGQILAATRGETHVPSCARQDREHPWDGSPTNR